LPLSLFKVIVGDPKNKWASPDAIAN